MNRKKALQSNRRGSTMALVLSAVVMLLVLGVGLLGLGTHARMLTARTASGIAARCAADAGLTKALFEMNKQLKIKPWNNSTLPEESCVYTNLSDSGVTSYGFTVTGNIGSGYTVESTGRSGSAVRNVRCNLALRGVFDHAIFTRGKITLKNGTSVDMYNCKGDDCVLQIGTNSTQSSSVVMKSGVTVNGDVIVGVGGDPDVVIDSKNEATITGETYAASMIYELPPVTVPESLQLLPSLGNLKKGTTINGIKKYGRINLNNDEIITIDGPTTLYVTGDVILDNSAQLQVVDASVNPDAYLILYLGGDFISRNGGAINNMAKDPQKVKIYGLDSCRSIKFITETDFYGAVYAPSADIRAHNSVEVYGAVTANTFIQDVFADFHYDASLKKVKVDDEGVRFVIDQWREQ